VQALQDLQVVQVLPDRLVDSLVAKVKLGLQAVKDSRAPRAGLQAAQEKSGSPVAKVISAMWAAPDLLDSQDLEDSLDPQG
jgi:hypothetical protein